MDLNASFHALEDCVTRPLLWSMLGTHRLRGLDCPMRPTSVLSHVDILTSLTSTLSHDLSTCTDATFRNDGGAHCNFRSSSDNRSWCKSLSLSLSWVDLSLLYDSGLVARTHIYLVLGTDSAARIGSQVFYLSDVTSSLLLPLHIVQDYS